MTKEERQILLKDLCMRLPYGVKVKSSRRQTIMTLSLDIMTDFHLGCTVKPYLRSMSSMTEEEKQEYTSYVFEQPFLQKDKVANLGSVTMCIDWLIAHHFDYRGLIEKSLALEAPMDMYKTE